MATDVKVPAAGESISEVVIGAWLKSVGDAVAADEPVVELETDKATLELPAPVAGVLTEQLFAEGDTVAVGDVIARIDETQAAAAAAPPAPAAEPAAEAPAAQPAAAPAPARPTPEAPPAAAGARPATVVAEAPAGVPAASVMPAAQRLLSEHGLSADEVPATGPGGRLLKEDVLRYLEEREREAAEAAGAVAAPAAAAVPAGPRQEERVRMSPLRRTIAERLVNAQHTAALLTTFNEIDMSHVITLRKEYREAFEQRYGVRLGFMSFFVKAAVEALKRQPVVNASIDGNDIVYHGYQDIGVAVSSDRGLVVPVLRNAEFMSLAEIEAGIANFGRKAKEGKLTIEEMTGGTFTISNGGVFGSLLSSPIVNPPQSAILGMHKIQERPMAVNGQVVILPMMYLALSYDHRLLDGKEAVTFLVTIKELLEDPARLLLDI